MQVEDIFSDASAWTCTSCTLSNPADVLFCDACKQRSHALDVSFQQLARAARDLGYPFIGSWKDLDVLPKNNRGEFSLSPTFHPDFLVAVVKHGAFPMTTNISRIPIMAVKLHHERCLIDLRFRSPHVQTKTKKHANRYHFAINADDKAFDRAVAMIQRKHPSNWMSGMLVEGLKKVNSEEMRMVVWEVTERKKENLKKVSIVFVCFKVFNRDNLLVAVEIGYCHGKIYTSMTGAFEEDGAGSVQLATTAGWLLSNNFLVWDFGMHMGYKQDLGAITVPRTVWLEFVSALGGKVKPWKDDHGECAPLARTKKICTDIETLSVSELKHMAKVAKVDISQCLEKKEMMDKLISK